MPYGSMAIAVSRAWMARSPPLSYRWKKSTAICSTYQHDYVCQCHDDVMNICADLLLRHCETREDQTRSCRTSRARVLFNCTSLENFGYGWVVHIVQMYCARFLCSYQYWTGVLQHVYPIVNLPHGAVRNTCRSRRSPCTEDRWHLMGHEGYVKSWF
jgi:hypothetical protein